jgi:transcriptional regulator with XRE-family HTH domain
MSLRKGLASALRQIRTSRNLTQEDFAEVSSRTYLSSLERAMKSPTLDKVEELCSVLEVHPITLLALAYCHSEKIDLENLYATVSSEMRIIANSGEDVQL